MPPRETPGKQYGADSNTQMMTSVRLTQEITDTTSDTTVTLKNPSSVVNATNVGANIELVCVDDGGAKRIEYFGAGQEKMRRVVTIGSNTTATKVLVCES
jgi:hypothetical protein